MQGQGQGQGFGFASGSTSILLMEPKTAPGLQAPPASRNRIDPDVEMTSQEPGTNPGQFQDKQQTTNRAPVSRQQQQQLLQGSPRMPLVLPGGPSGATIPQMPRPSMSNSNPMPGSGGTTGTLQIDMYSIAQTQQPQQLTSQNQMLYHQQQQQQQQQQQLQSLLRAKMQMSSALAGGSGMMSIVPTSGMQQSQMNSAQQRPVGQGQGQGFGFASGSASGAAVDPPNADWRLQLQPDARQRIANKIMDTLKRHLPVPVPDGLSELQKIAIRFEQKIYDAATTLPDYLRRISLKMLSTETKTSPGLQPAPFIQEDKIEEKTRKCKICGDCAHKRRKS